ncbi:MAG: formylglycine-generating enzyme family protein [Lentisphaerae bacterium]|nr:formylglycine-generating enzyme family protein [Lentisphaerota bacterium]
MRKTMSWLARTAAAVLAAGWVQAAEPAAAKSPWPLWDGKESVADYAKRAGIKDVEMTLDLGRCIVSPENIQAGTLRVKLGEPANTNVTMKLTLVPAGKFRMGAREPVYAVVEGMRQLLRDWEAGVQCHEAPQREVTISKPFYMGAYEVTQEQYLQIMKEIQFAHYGSLQSRGRTLPVDGNRWEDTVEFCRRVSTLTGQTVTLPTEAQWEYACRAGSTERFCFGDEEEKLCQYANYDSKNHKTLNEEGKDVTYDDGFDGYAPVGSFKPSKFGLYDMHGNVSEWVNDWMGNDDVNRKRGRPYHKEGTLDPTGPDGTWPEGVGSYKISRGGSFKSSPAFCRAATRPLHGHSEGGFRVVMTVNR